MQENSFTTDDLNSGKIEGISSFLETDTDRKHITIGLSADIRPKTFVFVLQFLYGGKTFSYYNGININRDFY